MDQERNIFLVNDSLKKLSQRIGFDEAYYFSDQLDKKALLKFYVQITIDDTKGINLEEYIINKVLDKIRNSDFIVKNITAELFREIEDCHTKIEKLTQKNKELICYKNYFDIQMTLNHGFNEKLENGKKNT